MFEWIKRDEMNFKMFCYDYFGCNVGEVSVYYREN